MEIPKKKRKQMEGAETSEEIEMERIREEIRIEREENQGGGSPPGGVRELSSLMPQGT